MKKEATFHPADYPSINGTTLEHSSPEELLELKEYFAPFTFVHFDGEIIPFLKEKSKYL